MHVCCPYPWIWEESPSSILEGPVANGNRAHRKVRIGKVPQRLYYHVKRGKGEKSEGVIWLPHFPPECGGKPWVLQGGMGRLCETLSPIGAQSSPLLEAGGNICSREITHLPQGGQNSAYWFWRICKDRISLILFLYIDKKEIIKHKVKKWRCHHGRTCKISLK